MKKNEPQPESGSSRDLRRKGVLRYVELAAAFRRRIEVGEWARGAQIPTVVELSGSCSVAKETIRQALGVLEAEGLIARHRAKGTFVTGDKKDLWCEIDADYFGLLQAREGADIELMAELRNVNAPRSLDFGHPAGLYRHLQRRHRRLGEPYLATDVYIAEHLIDQIPRSAFTTKTALRIVADVPSINVARVEQIMTIGPADDAMSQTLHISLNAPVAFVDRYVLGVDGELLLLSRGTYRGDIVRLRVRLKGG